MPSDEDERDRALAGLEIFVYFVLAPAEALLWVVVVLYALGVIR